jgi:hypothetical protein
MPGAPSRSYDSRCSPPRRRIPLRGECLSIGWTQSGAYGGAVSNAVCHWHATSTPVIPYYTDDYATSQADFYTQYRPETWWGLAVHHPCVGSGCSYDWVDLYLNSRTLASQSPFLRQKVAAHEFGHALGLAHVPPSATYNSIMKQGSLSYNTPRPHDVNDTNALYPGSYPGSCFSAEPICQ